MRFIRRFLDELAEVWSPTPTPVVDLPADVEAEVWPESAPGSLDAPPTSEDPGLLDNLNDYLTSLNDLNNTLLAAASDQLRDLANALDPRAQK